MIRKFRRITVFVLIGSLAIATTSRPAKAQVQVLAPALCSTGVGCALIGVAVVGGIAYYVWQSRDTGKQHYVKIEDPGNIPGQQETHYAASAEGCQKMRQRFKNEGRKLRLIRIKPVKAGVICIFQGEDARPGYYNDRR
jgi:hypothetical protein